MKQVPLKFYQNSLILLFLMLVVPNAHAQITYSEEEAVEEEAFEFIDVSDEIFGLQNEVNTVLKALISGSNNRGSLVLGLEQKFGKAFSVDMGLGLTAIDYSDSNELLGQLFNTAGLEVFVEPRIYYGMKKGVLNGTRAKNVNGRYLGLNGSYLFSGVNKNLSGYSVNAKMGVQTTFLNKGLFDANIFAGINQSPQLGHSFSMGTQLKIGFGWIQNKNKQVDAEFCDAFRCFEENLEWWKVDVVNLPRIGINQYGAFLKPRLKISRETKLQNSVSNSISFAGYAAADFTAYVDDFLFLVYPDSIPESFRPNEQDFYVGGEIGLRHYLSKQKKIAQGKSSNNMNGLYIEGIAFAEMGYSRYSNFEFINFEGFGITLGTEVHFGLQQRILDRFYVDVFLNFRTFKGRLGFNSEGPERERANLSLGYTF